MLTLRNLQRIVVGPSKRCFKLSPSRSSDNLFVHRDTADNNPDIPFEFTCENQKRLCEIIKHYPAGYECAAVGAALDIAQRQLGWLPIYAINAVADFMSMPRMRVYEHVTFYTMYRRQYKGKLFVQVCGTTPCMLRGSELIMEAACRATGAPAGGVSGDGLFGVEEVECLGACVNAPVMAVNDDYYEDLTPECAVKILEELRAGNIPAPGPQGGCRFACEPSNGLTSLREPPPGPGCNLQKDLQ